MKKIAYCFSLIILFFSCKKTVEEEIAVIWTDKVEVVSYCELFNASQDKYRLIVEYKKNPAEEILKRGASPDIVIASFLKGSATLGKFSSLDYLLKNDIDVSLFYEELLSLGNIDGVQYLLPVSFNLPTIIFSISNRHLLEDNFLISFEELKKLSAQLNIKKKNTYTKLSFAPRWEEDLLYIAMQGMEADFEEDTTKENIKDLQEGAKMKGTFKWNEENLNKAIEYLKAWSKEANENSQIEDEFKFKYLYDVPYLSVSNGFCSFYYMSTERLFSIAKDKMENLDFRYLDFGGRVPCEDDILYAGIMANSKNKKASETFFVWFYTPSVQQQLLMKNINENVFTKEFGIAGGFSSLKPITEKAFPKYYPLLLSHLPPTNALKTPRILPNNWKLLKEEILYPYLLEATYYTDSDNSPSSLSLKDRITAWVDKN